MSSAEVNVLTITSDYLSAASYVDASFQITPGQPVTAYPSVAPPVDHVYTVSVTCGREGSTTMTDGFNAAATTQYNELAETFWAAQPGELNFYFAVQLTFYGATPVTIYLAQGSNTTHNNWWIGGRSILNSSPGKSKDAYLMIDRTHLYWVSVTGANALSISTVP